MAPSGGAPKIGGPRGGNYRGELTQCFRFQGIRQRQVRADDLPSLFRRIPSHQKLTFRVGSVVFPPDTLTFPPNTLTRRIPSRVFGGGRFPRVSLFGAVAARRIPSLPAGYPHFPPDTLTFRWIPSQRGYTAAVFRAAEYAHQRKTHIF